MYVAPDGFVGYYIHSFTLSNLSIPLPKFVCKVLNYYQDHLYRDKLTFGKRPKADVLKVFLKPFSHLRYWKGRFFYIQNTVVPSDYPTLLLKDNRHPAYVRTFPDPILYVAGLKLLWNHSPHQPANYYDGKELAFRNFMFIEDDVDTSFLVNEPLGDFELLDLHDRCYARHEVVDNIVNRRSHELLKTVKKEKDFDKNHVVIVLRQKIVSLLSDVKDHQGNLEKMLLESQKWAGYKETLVALESKVVTLEGKKARLEGVETQLRQEVDNVKCDKAEVVSKVVSYIAMELVHSDEIRQLVSRVATFAIFYGRCIALEKVSKVKDPLDLAKVPSYRTSYKEEYTKAGNDLQLWSIHFSLKLLQALQLQLMSFFTRFPIHSIVQHLRRPLLLSSS
nr:hypothetical protein [Tanacetum cinerariifolium]